MSLTVPSASALQAFDLPFRGGKRLAQLLRLRGIAYMPSLPRPRHQRRQQDFQPFGAKISSSCPTTRSLRTGIGMLRPRQVVYLFVRGIVAGVIAITSALAGAKRHAAAAGRTFREPVGKVGPVRTRAAPEPMPTHADEFNKVPKKPIDLIAEFERASRSGEGSGRGGRRFWRRTRRPRLRSQFSGASAPGSGRRSPSAPQAKRGDRARTAKNRLHRQSHAATAPGPEFDRGR